MITSEKVDKIIPALFQFQTTLEKIDKDSNNPFTSSNYASFDHIMDVIRPKLMENKIFIMQIPSGEPDKLTVKTRLWHESGQWIESTGTSLKPQKLDPQGSGGAITYAKRYDLCAFLSINTGDDDDGNAASGRTNQQQKSQTQQKNQQKPKQEQKKQTPSEPESDPAKVVAKKEDVNHFIKRCEEFATMRKQTLEAMLKFFQIKSKEDAYRLSEKAIKTYTNNVDNFIQKAKKEKSA